MSRLTRPLAAAVLAAAALALVPASASAEVWCPYLGENEVRVDDVVVRYPWIKSRC